MQDDLDRRAFLARASAIAAAAAGLSALSCRSSEVVSTNKLAESVNYSATDAIAAMKRGDIRAEDYAMTLIDRAQALEKLNAFHGLDRDKVVAAARAADKLRNSGAKLGKLHGLPIPVKDSINTAAYVTSNGTKMLTAYHPTQDAGVLKPLLAAGAIVMGKTNLHELSLGWTSASATYGPVRNPYDQSCVPGGSSGGSAVAVAARMAPLAVGEDTLGSIRIPSTMCGIAGLRPSFGRYPRDGILALTDNKFDTPGPLARTVDDLILFDSVITGDESVVMPTPLSSVRIGVPDFFWSGLDSEVERVSRDALARLAAAGATLVPVKLPDSVRGAQAIALGVLAYEVVAQIKKFLSQEKIGVTFQDLIDQTTPDVQATIKAVSSPANHPTEAVYAQILAGREGIKADIKALFAKEKLSVLAFSPAMVPPPEVADVSQVARIASHDVPRTDTMARNISLGSCASLASLVLPAGLTKNGLPIGMEFDALNGDDRVLLAIGKSLEKALGPIAAPKV